jgi:hypothetical protein
MTNELSETIRQLQDAKTLRSKPIELKPKNIICKPKDLGTIKRILNASESIS